MPKELRGTKEQYLHEEKVVALNGLLFNYAMGLFPADVVSNIQEKLVQYNLPRLDGNKYGATDRGFTIVHKEKTINLNHPLGLCEAYVAYRYAKFAHTDNNFLDHAIAACCLRGIRDENTPLYNYRQGDFDGGNFYMAKWGILLKMTGNFYIKCMVYFLNIYLIFI